jgi:hypothetical protein
MSQKVEEYIKKQESPQKEIISRLRKLILRTLPNMKEDFKLGVPWYEEKFYLVGLRDHVNLGFAVKGLSESEMALFEGKGKIMRHRKFFDIKDINETEIAKLLDLVAKKTLSCH